MVNNGQYGQKRFVTAKTVQNGQKWSTMGKSSQQWSTMINRVKRERKNPLKPVKTDKNR